MKKTKCKWFELCPLKRFTEEGKIGKYWTEKYCFGEYLKCERYKLEESGIFHPDNMLCDGSIRKDLK